MQARPAPVRWSHSFTFLICDLTHSDLGSRILVQTLNPDVSLPILAPLSSFGSPPLLPSYYLKGRKKGNSSSSSSLTAVASQGKIANHSPSLYLN